MDREITEGIPHVRLCPAISIAYDEYVSAINTGQYHWSERDELSRRRDSANAKFAAVNMGTEDCQGPELIHDDGEVKLRCAVKDKTWTLEDIKKLYEGHTGDRPSLYFSLKMLEQPETSSVEDA